MMLAAEPTGSGGGGGVWLAGIQACPPQPAATGGAADAGKDTVPGLLGVEWCAGATSSPGRWLGGSTLMDSGVPSRPAGAPGIVGVTVPADGSRSCIGEGVWPCC